MMLMMIKMNHFKKGNFDVNDRIEEENESIMF